MSPRTVGVGVAETLMIGYSIFAAAIRHSDTTRVPLHVATIGTSTYRNHTYKSPLPSAS